MLLVRRIAKKLREACFWKSKLLRYSRYIRARELRKALKQWCIMHKRSFEARLEFQINLFKAVLVYKDEVKDYIGGNLRFKCDGSRNELKTLYRYIFCFNDGD